MKKTIEISYEIEIKKTNNDSIEFICQNEDYPSEYYNLIMTLKEFNVFHSVFKDEDSINNIYNKIADQSNEFNMRKIKDYAMLEIKVKNILFQFHLKYKNNGNNTSSIHSKFLNNNIMKFLSKYLLYFLITFIVGLLFSLILGIIALNKSKKLEKIVGEFTKNYEIIEKVEEKLNQKVDKIYIDNVNDNSIPYNEKPFSYYVNLKNDFAALENPI